MPRGIGKILNIIFQQLLRTLACHCQKSGVLGGSFFHVCLRIGKGFGLVICGDFGRSFCHNVGILSQGVFVYFATQNSCLRQRDRNGVPFYLNGYTGSIYTQANHTVILNPELFVFAPKQEGFGVFVVILGYVVIVTFHHRKFADCFHLGNIRRQGGFLMGNSTSCQQQRRDRKQDGKQFFHGISSSGVIERSRCSRGCSGPEVAGSGLLLHSGRFAGPGPEFLPEWRFPALHLPGKV